MSGDDKASSPPAGRRFQKGKSGNPKGRPKKASTPAPSGLDAVFDRPVVAMQNGERRELPVDEALDRKTYQDAFADDRASQRDVVGMILKREKWRAEREPRPYDSVVKFEHGDPDNANAALLLLGIAGDERRSEEPQDHGLVLNAWAVQAALSRPGRPPLSGKDLEGIERHTRDAGTLRWPRGGRNGR